MTVLQVCGGSEGRRPGSSPAPAGNKQTQNLTRHRRAGKRETRGRANSNKLEQGGSTLTHTTCHRPRTNKQRHPPLITLVNSSRSDRFDSVLG